MSTTTEEVTQEHNWFLRWKHTWSGRVAWTLVDLAIAYIFGSLAVNSGSLWQWGLVILFVIDALYNLGRFIGIIIHGRHRTHA